jgi:hypothetical protein
LAGIEKHSLPPLQLNTPYTVCLQVNKVGAGFARWEGLTTGSAERDRLTRELESGCESVEWQVGYDLLFFNYLEVQWCFNLMMFRVPLGRHLIH